eukprot:CAMPEP_0185383340 /NCGR_PEP_ID=MMETSP1364-20130426/57334_1 /TAXON_ID=38817 /ORGANISM="Gephyrocapsa oceanica, Strain RCC1303" /LENGTH=37 /DNA_ID= /DNA_START= /DNA_END= /DNA_ORIENTATION=
MKSACAREERSFIAVAAFRLQASPCEMSARAASTEST